MAVGENKALVRRFIELLAPGYVHHANTAGGARRDQYRANIGR